jgi:hypothetical protein
VLNIFQAAVPSRFAAQSYGAISLVLAPHL